MVARAAVAVPVRWALEGPTAWSATTSPSFTSRPATATTKRERIDAKHTTMCATTRRPTCSTTSTTRSISTAGESPPSTPGSGGRSGATSKPMTSGKPSERRTSTPGRDFAFTKAFAGSLRQWANHRRVELGVRPDDGGCDALYATVTQTPTRSPSRCPTMCGSRRTGHRSWLRRSRSSGDRDHTEHVPLRKTAQRRRAGDGVGAKVAHSATEMRTRSGSSSRATASVSTFRSGGFKRGEDRTQRPRRHVDDLIRIDAERQCRRHSQRQRLLRPRSVRQCGRCFRPGRRTTAVPGVAALARVDATTWSSSIHGVPLGLPRVDKRRNGRGTAVDRVPRPCVSPASGLPRGVGARRPSDRPPRSSR